ncbi:MAG TPA: RidA family protein [Chloroflexota bacterium]
MTEHRQRVSSGTPWEPMVGYSRALRVGAHVYVSGTTATDPDGQIVGEDTYTQAVQALRNIQWALASLGVGLEHVVRTRMFVTNIEDAEQIARAHSEFFGEIRPTTTLVEVSRLILPEMLVEIEADAIVTER